MNTQVIETVVSIEADDAKNLPSRIHLLRVGKFETQKYGTLEITANDLTEMAANYKAGIGRPGQGGSGYLPVNFGHDKGGKAAAWIKDLVVEGDDLYGITDWTGSGRAAVEAKDYGFISSEFTPRCMGGLWAAAEDATKRFRNVFTGAALTNIPMFNGNKGIMASAEGDNDQVIFINADAKELSMNLDQLRVKDAADLTADERTFIEAHVEELSADEKTKFNIDATAIEEGAKVTPVSIEAAAAGEGVVSVEASELKKIVDKNAELQAKVEASESAKSELQKTVDAHAADLKTIKRKDIDASVVEHGVNAGRIVADEAGKWADLIEADATMLDTLKAIPANKVVEAGAQGADVSGDGAVSASDEANTKAKELMEKNTNLTISDALSQVFASDEDLGKRYAAETNGVN